MTFVSQKNVRLARFTTLKIGGAARFFGQARNEFEVVEAIGFARKNNLRVFILGGGSNVLIADKGFDGLVLQIALKGISVSREADGVVSVIAQAGEDWDNFVEFCVGRNLQGVECLSGIPGFIGGTPIQNVGAYGQEVSETIVSVKVLERKTGKIFQMSAAACRFAYRASVFNSSEKNRFIVLAVTFDLKFNGEPKIFYKDLQNFFGEQKPDLKETREAVLQIRRAKSMVIDALDPNSKSAGSFFKNPIVTTQKFAEIESKVRESGVIGDKELLPNYPAGENSLKIPAAWLIEKSGFHKGFRLGKVGISARHTLAIINFGEATAREILDLKDKIQVEVLKTFGVELLPEPIFVGFDE